MDVRRLKGLDALTRLLECDERDTPGMVLLCSSTCPRSLELRAQIHEHAQTLPQFVFYEFDIDDYSAPAQDLAVTRLLDELHTGDLPAQILLPSSSRPSVVNAISLTGIRKALHQLY